MIFIGYDESSKGYRAYDPVNNRVHITRDTIFDEAACWNWEAGDAITPSSDFAIEYLARPPPALPAGGATSSAPASPAPVQGSSIATSSPGRSPAPTTPSPGSTPSLPQHFTPSYTPAPPPSPDFVSPLSNDDERVDAFHDDEPLWYRTVDNIIGDAPIPGEAHRKLHFDSLLLASEDEPRSFGEAENDAAWRASMKEEMDSIERNGTWELVNLPRGHRPIGLRWVFKIKKNEAGDVIKHKARLIAKGYVQQHGIDFDEVFAPVARMESVRLMLALAAHQRWSVHHMDVKSTFLNGVLEEEVYVSQPLGFVVAGQEGKVLRLKNALYGLRQAPRAWNSRLDATLKDLGFKQSPHEHAVYGRGHGDGRLLVGVYVDDLIIT